MDNLTFAGFGRLFVAMAVIMLGYGFAIIRVFIKPNWVVTLQLITLLGLASLFSYLIFNDTDMLWSGDAILSDSIILGMATAAVIYYLFFFLIKSVIGFNES